MINALATVPVKFVMRAFDKLYAHFEAIGSKALPVIDYWEKKLVKGYLVEETRRMVLPNWKIEEWNIFEKIINNEETSTCKLEAWHQTLDKLLMKDLRFNASKAEKNRHDRIHNVASSVNTFHTIVEYLNAMAVTSKK